jgi:hypothetical protein
MYRIVHIFILFVMVAMVISPAAVVAQAETPARTVYSGEFEMMGEFTREGRYWINSASGENDYFAIMPGDNITIGDSNYSSGQKLLLDDWLMRISVNSSNAKHDNGDHKKVRATGDLRFSIGGSHFEGRLKIEQAICQSIRQPTQSGLFEGCYKYELRGTLRFVEVPADAAEI